MKLFLCSLIVMMLLGVFGSSSRSLAKVSATSPLDFTMKSIDGQDVSLSIFKGKVVLIVNVASKCGFTKQYAGLQTLYQRYQDRGLVVLGFPANNFMGQEPGDDEEIKQFCTTKFDVSFPMFSKISVKGKDQAELYQWLTDKSSNPEFGGNIKWNFTKFLVGRQGNVIARFEPGVGPLAQNVVLKIESALEAR